MVLVVMSAVVFTTHQTLIATDQELRAARFTGGTIWLFAAKITGATVVMMPPVLRFVTVLVGQGVRGFPNILPAKVRWRRLLEIIRSLSSHRCRVRHECGSERSYENEKSSSLHVSCGK